MKRRANHEGTIFKDSRGYWIAEYLAPTGKKVRKASKKQSVVREWLQHELSRIRRGEWTGATRRTVGEYCDRFLSEVAPMNLQPTTISSYRWIIDSHIKPEIGHVELARLTPGEIQSLYARKMGSGLSKRSVEFIHAVLRRVMNEAVKNGLIARNPTAATTPPEPDRKEPTILTVEQIRLLLKHVKTSRYWEAYYIGAGTGPRPA